jgi:hypothetical protein
VDQASLQSVIARLLHPGAVAHDGDKSKEAGRQAVSSSRLAFANTRSPAFSYPRIWLVEGRKTGSRVARISHHASPTMLVPILQSFPHTLGEGSDSFPAGNFACASLGGWWLAHNARLRNKLHWASVSGNRPKKVFPHCSAPHSWRVKDKIDCFRGVRNEGETHEHVNGRWQAAVMWV